MIVVFSIVCAVLAVVCAEKATITVQSLEPLKFSLEPAVIGSSYVATATYSDSVDHKSNFGQLFVSTTKEFDDPSQGFAAGFAEGFLTAERIFQNYQNLKCQVSCDGSRPKEVEGFFLEQYSWMKQQVADHASSDYWQFIGVVGSQFDGLMAGYAASEFGRSNPLDMWAFMMLNGIGDLFDILPAMTVSRRPNFHEMNYASALDYMNRNGHCSALLRALDDLSDVFVGHSSWFTYSAMLRIYKTYSFDLHNKRRAAKTISFSSYPGFLSSLDDMYLMAESKMIMTQTTNSIFNETLWDLIVPQSLLAWQRVRAANQLANTGPEWYELVRQYNSGTYNNQYMVLDGKLFTPGNALQPGTLFVVEQIPGLVMGGEVTDQLERGYWSSYNVPYFKDIYIRSGYPMVDAKAGVMNFTQYQQAPRAKIFRRDQSSVKDLASMQMLMRSNEYQTDPFSDGSPWNAICARGDLAVRPSANGAYDTKITSINMLLPHTAGESGKALVHMESTIINGPTSQDQTPFSWTKSGLTDPHIGQPDLFDFEFETVYLEL